MTNAAFLRSEALRRRRALTAAQRAIASASICERVVASRWFSASNRLACYLPMRDEVDPGYIIERAWRANKRVFVPVTLDKGRMQFREIRPESVLIRNRWSLWEPVSGDIVPPQHLQLVVTPTVAFDASLHRIGMGGGFYDRCFAFLRHRKHWFTPKLIGVAFNCQEVEKIQANAWDIRLYRIFCG